MKIPNNQDHAAISELLPWYANNTLTRAEQALVEAHLPTCQTCQAQLAECRQLSSNLLTHREQAAWQPSAMHFSQIMASIDGLASDGPANQSASSPIQAARKPKQFSLFAPWLAWFKATPNPVAWLMVAEGFAIAALMLVVGIPSWQQTEAPLFRTFSDNKAVAVPGLVRLSIVFTPEITELEIRELLQTQQGQIVQGPSMLGVYTLELADSSETAVLRAVDGFRQHPKVKLVERVVQ